MSQTLAPVRIPEDAVDGFFDWIVENDIVVDGDLQFIQWKAPGSTKAVPTIQCRLTVPSPGAEMLMRMRWADEGVWWP